MKNVAFMTSHLNSPSDPGFGEIRNTASEIWESAWPGTRVIAPNVPESSTKNQILQTPINFLPRTNTYHKNDQTFVLNLIENPVFSNSQAVKVLLAFELLAAWGPRIISKSVNLVPYAPLV